MVIKVILFIVFIAAIIGFGVVAGIKFYNSYEDNGKTSASGIVFTFLAVLSLFGTIFIPGNIHQVNTGEVAVVRTMGKVSGVREAGVYWDFYMVNSYEIYDTKVQDVEIDTSAYTLDKQTVDLQFSLQYEIDQANVDKLATQYGTIDKVESKITSIALDKIKSIFAQNNADAIIENRSGILTQVNEAVTTSIDSSYYVNIKTVVLTNIEFTDDYETAVAAKVAQQQAYEKALIEQQQALAAAKNEAEIATVKAEAEKEVAIKKAEADMEVAKIAADSAEYQGKKDAAIALQKLASVNGWTVVTEEVNGNTINRLYKPDGTLVTETELAKGVENLIAVYKIEKWDGSVPQYQMGESGVVTVVQP